jgi:hypothetical protein
MVTSDDNNPNKPNSTPNIPQADLDFRDASITINNSWHQNSQITLIWINQSDLETLVTNFSTTLMLRKSSGGERPEFTKKLELIDKDIDRDIENVKRYLEEKYGKDSASSYYSQFGIVKEHKIYKLPIDHDDRKAALELLIPALTTHGFQNNTFGLTYWTGVKTKFNDYLAKTVDIDGIVSNKVGDKNLLKKQINKVLNSLIKVIMGNYPDDYKNVLRNWGFQKEKY